MVPTAGTVVVTPFAVDEDDTDASCDVLRRSRRPAHQRNRSAFDQSPRTIGHEGHSAVFDIAALLNLTRANAPSLVLNSSRKPPLEGVSILTLVTETRPDCDIGRKSALRPQYGGTGFGSPPTNRHKARNARRNKSSGRDPCVIRRSTA